MSNKNNKQGKNAKVDNTVKPEGDATGTGAQPTENTGAGTGEIDGGSTDIGAQPTENTGAGTGEIDGDSTDIDIDEIEKVGLTLRHTSHTKDYFRCGLRLTKQWADYEVSLEDAVRIKEDKWVEVKEDGK